MTERDNESGQGKWAPWWVYVVVIIGLNFAKQRLMEGLPAAVNIAVTVGLVAVLIVAITAVYRKVIARQ